MRRCATCSVRKNKNFNNNNNRVVNVQSMCFFFGGLISSVLALHTVLASPSPVRLCLAAITRSTRLWPATFGPWSSLLMFMVMTVSNSEDLWCCRIDLGDKNSTTSKVLVLKTASASVWKDWNLEERLVLQDKCWCSREISTGLIWKRFNLVDLWWCRISFGAHESRRFALEIDGKTNSTSGDVG